MAPIFFLVSDLTAADSVVDRLLTMGIEEKNIHLIARENTPLQPLSEELSEQNSALQSSLRKGRASGGKLGSLAGLEAVALSDSLVLAGGAVLATTLMQIELDNWFSNTVSTEVPFNDLQPYQEAIDNGQLLFTLYNIDPAQIEAIRELISNYQPNVELKKMDYGEHRLVRC